MQSSWAAAGTYLLQDFSDFTKKNLSTSVEVTCTCSKELVISN